MYFIVTFTAESKYYLSWWRCFFGDGISGDWSWQRETCLFFTHNRFFSFRVSKAPMNKVEIFKDFVKTFAGERKILLVACLLAAARGPGWTEALCPAPGALQTRAGFAKVKSLWERQRPACHWSLAEQSVVLKLFGEVGVCPVFWDCRGKEHQGWLEGASWIEGCV